MDTLLTLHSPFGVDDRGKLVWAYRPRLLAEGNINIVYLSVLLRAGCFVGMLAQSLFIIANMVLGAAGLGLYFHHGCGVCSFRDQ